MDSDELDNFTDLAMNSEKLEAEEAQYVFSVSDFVAVSNQTFEYSFASVLIEGEVASFKINQNKYVFFDLKDGESSLACFMSLWQMRFPLKDGMKIVVKAQPKLTNWGKFSLTIKQIIPKGEGSLKKSFDILKMKLDKEGIFLEEKKRPLPDRPSNIAVISSVQSAGYADFIKILNERWGGIKIKVAHTQVQGFAAADQIISAINYFNQSPKLPEAIVLIRGGGSADDLATFSDEKLVRAIASSRVPILTGIGHEIDQSLSDLAADYSASTPSNAAQILVPDKKSEMNFVKSKIDHLGRNIINNIDMDIQLITAQTAQIGQLLSQMINDKITEIDSKRRMLESYNPELVLRQGYAIINGLIAQGSTINIETRDKIIKAKVEDVRRKSN